MDESIIQLFRAGAHHVARGLIQFGKGVVSFIERVPSLVGSGQGVPSTAAQSFFNMVTQSYRASEQFRGDVVPPLASIPVVPGVLSSQRFFQEGITEVTLPGNRQPGAPATVKLPFRRETPEILSQNDLEREFADALDNELSSFNEKYEKLLDYLKFYQATGQEEKIKDVEVIITHIYRTR